MGFNEVGGAIYRGSNHYAHRLPNGHIECMSYKSHVATIIDGILCVDMEYIGFSISTTKHLNKFFDHFKCRGRRVVDSTKMTHLKYVEDLLKVQGD